MQHCAVFVGTQPQVGFAVEVQLLAGLQADVGGRLGGSVSGGESDAGHFSSSVASESHRVQKIGAQSLIGEFVSVVLKSKNSLDCKSETVDGMHWRDSPVMVLPATGRKSNEIFEQKNIEHVNMH